MKQLCWTKTGQSFFFTRKAFVALSLVWFLVMGAATAQEVAPNAPRSLSDDIALVGHSLVNREMPHMLRHFVASLGGTGLISEQVINGSPLQYNWDQAATAEGTNVRALIGAGGPEALVLAEAGPIENYFHASGPSVGQYAGNFGQWYDHAVANGVEQVFLYQIWPYLNWAGGTWPLWRSKIDADRHRFEAIADSRPDVLIVPGGGALAALYDAVQVGTVPGIADTAAFRNLIFSSEPASGDDVNPIHLTFLGNYFIACVQFATVYRRSPVGLPTSTPHRFGGPDYVHDPVLTRRLQEIAWETVTSYSRTGMEGS